MADLEIYTQVKWFKDDTTGRFASLPEKAREALLEVAQEGAVIAAARAPEGDGSSPRTRPPGRLKRSIHARRTALGAEFYSDAPHALPIEYGAGPHPISGRPFLSFPTRTPKLKKVATGRNAGKVVVRHVEHPGNAAKPFMIPAYRAIEGKIIATIRRYVG